MDRSANSEKSLQWRGDWRTSVFAGLLLPVLVGLGFWQLQRAAEKEQLSATWAARQQEAPQSLPAAETPPGELAYRRVAMSGQFLSGRQFLLDNSMRRGRYGLEVLEAFRLHDSGRLVLVNRGWVAGDPGRRQQPRVSTPMDRQQLQGTIYVPPGTPYTLGPETDSGSWPRQLLTLDMAAVSAMLGEAVFPYSVRLDAASPAALEANWPLVNTQPEKHRAYALQWFSMAFALVCLYLAYSSNALHLLGLRRGDSDD